jgi:hypothetical protein
VLHNIEKKNQAPTTTNNLEPKHQHSELSIGPLREEPVVTELGRRKPWTVVAKGRGGQSR